MTLLYLAAVVLAIYGVGFGHGWWERGHAEHRRRIDAAREAERAARAA